jgi:hypothetical protein
MDDEETASLREKALALDEATEHLIEELCRRIQVIRSSHHPQDDPDSSFLDDEPVEDEKVVIEQLLSVSGSVFLSFETTTHLQFALFALCGRSDPCARYFLNWLWEKLRNPMSLPAVRESALGYAASFLCRAGFLSTE